MLLVPWADAATVASPFDTDAGGWEGGTVGDGVLSVTSPATLTVSDMLSFTLTMRVRVVSGTTLSLANTSTFLATYGAGGGLSFAGGAQPFGAAELVWEPAATAALAPVETWEAAGLSDPELVEVDGAWRLYYTGTAADGATSIGVATSADRKTWTRRSTAICTGAAPDIHVGDGEVILHYACGDDVCRAGSEDGLAFTELGTALTDAGSPSVARDEDGTWHLWTSVPGTRGTGHATSAGGSSWKSDADVSPDDARLYEVDVLDNDGTFDGVYTLGDSLGFAPGGDATFASDDDDIRPLLGSTAWASGEIGSAGLARDGNSWLLAMAGDGAVGLAEGIPTAGQWMTLVLAWDGTEISATWGGGRPMVATATPGDTFTLTTDGEIEIAEYSLAYQAVGVDTGAPIDTGAPLDTGDTADTAADSGTDTGATADSATEDSGPLDNASQRAHELGGYGCATVTRISAWALLLTAAALKSRRR